eukprot:10403699-Alexandrium_andersonii.AAC.1
MSRPGSRAGMTPLFVPSILRNSAVSQRAGMGTGSARLCGNCSVHTSPTPSNISSNLLSNGK